MVSNYVPEIEDFTKQQFLNRDALVALFDKIGPGILMVHSQAGAFAWPVADARPNLVKAIVGVEPNGPPFFEVNFIGPPDYFRQGKMALPLRPERGAAHLCASRQGAVRDFDRAGGQGRRSRPGALLDAEGAGAATAEPAEDAHHGAHIGGVVSRALRPLHREISGPGRREATHIKLADLGIHGNSHVMMNEKNNKEIAAVIAVWLDGALPAKP